MMNKSRAFQLISLVTMTSITMMLQYGLQGWLAAGGKVADIPQWVWIADAGAWSLRAVIESLVLAFLFSIQAENATAKERNVLLSFEVALIALITLTLGPTFASIGLQQSIVASLPMPLYWLWNFGIASYAPLMLGAMGFAYKLETRNATQPERNETVTESQHVATKAKPILPPKKVDRETAILQAIETGATRNSEIAKALNVAPSTVSRNLSAMVKRGELERNTGNEYAIVTNGATNEKR